MLVYCGFEMFCCASRSGIQEETVFENIFGTIFKVLNMASFCSFYQM